MKSLNYEELKKTVEDNRSNVGWAHVLHSLKMLESNEIGNWERIEQMSRLNKLMNRKGYALSAECFYSLLVIVGEKRVK